MIDDALRDLAKMVTKDEKVLWFAKPDKKCFILESIFNPLLPFALIWFLVDVAFMGAAIISTPKGAGLAFLIPFFLFHMLPVWLYLGGVLTICMRYKNAAYIITTKGVYISSGFLAKTSEMKPFTDLSHVSIHRGIFDQYLGVGDVVSTCVHGGASSHHSGGMFGFAICDIPDYERVFNMIKQLQEDIYSDTMFPNALRPEENPGYNVKYNKFKEINIDNEK